MEFAIDSELETDWFEEWTYLCFGVSYLIAMSFFFVSLSLESEMEDYETKAANVLKKYLNDENKLTFNRFGFEWKMGESFYWLEVHK
jgi:hypothetical protein